MSLYNDAMIEGFLDELYEIEKNAQILPAIGKFFQGGIKGLHNAVNLAPKGTPFMRRMGVTHPEGLTAQLKGAYERGAAGRWILGRNWKCSPTATSTNRWNRRSPTSSRLCAWIVVNGRSVNKKYEELPHQRSPVSIVDSKGSCV